MTDDGLLGSVEGREIGLDMLRGGDLRTTHEHETQSCKTTKGRGARTALGIGNRGDKRLTREEDPKMKLR